MTKDEMKKLFEDLLKEYSDAAKLGQDSLPSYFIVFAEKEKQLERCATAFAKSKQALKDAQELHGAKSVKAFAAYKVAKGYLTLLIEAMTSFEKEFNAAHTYANSVGTLEETVAAFNANAHQPEQIITKLLYPKVGSFNGETNDPVNDLINSIFKNKKDFGGN